MQLAHVAPLALHSPPLSTPPLSPRVLMKAYEGLTSSEHVLTLPPLAIRVRHHRYRRVVLQLVVTRGRLPSAAVQPCQSRSPAGGHDTTVWIRGAWGRNVDSDGLTVETLVAVDGDIRVAHLVGTRLGGASLGRQR